MDENRRFIRAIAKLLYISWHMCLLYSDSKVGLFLKWDRKREWGFRFLDKGEAGFFTDSFLFLRQQKKSVVHEARQTFIFFVVKTIGITSRKLNRTLQNRMLQLRTSLNHKLHEHISSMSHMP